MANSTEEEWWILADDPQNPRNEVPHFEERDEMRVEPIIDPDEDWDDEE
jgi:hypothetical protein